MRLLNKIIFML